MKRIRVFYNNFGTPEIYEVMRAEAPPELDLILLESDSDEERLCKIVDCDAVIVANARLTSALINAAPNLRVVQHQGVGYHDTVDIKPLIERGIALAITTAGTTGVAEHAVLLALAACRRLPFMDSELRQGRWHNTSLRQVSIELSGRTLGFIGMGRIGQAAAARFKAFGTRGLYHDPVVALSANRAAELGLEAVSLSRLLREADIVSLHLPLTAGTRNLLDRGRLSLMKLGSILVNTARGGLVDEIALIEGLRSGRPGAAGLDVFEQEPLPAGHPLATLPNVVLTPHIGAGTWDALQGKMRFALKNISGYFYGRALENEVPLGAAKTAEQAAVGDPG